MPKNRALFPDEFQLTGTLSDSGIGALEVAVNNLSSVSKSTAMRQANAIRVGGQTAIKNQNRGMPTLNSLLSIRSVGKYVVPRSEPTGTLGYFLGGHGDTSLPTITAAQRRVDRFTFSTNTIASLGNLLGQAYPFAIANTVSGYSVAANFNKFTFQSESMTPIGLALFPVRGGGSSLKNPNRGYFCSGSGGGTNYANVDRFSFVGEVCVAIATTVQIRGTGTGVGNRFNGYLIGGEISNSATSTIEKFQYATESKVDISAAISQLKGQFATWTPGNAFAAYPMGGRGHGRFPDPVNSAVRTFYSNTIDKFLFASETCAPLGTTLQYGTIALGSIGNPTRAVIAGGITHTDAYTTQTAGVLESTRIVDFTFTTEVNSILGAALSQGRYALAGFDNSSF